MTRIRPRGLFWLGFVCPVALLAVVPLPAVATDLPTVKADRCNFFKTDRFTARDKDLAFYGDCTHSSGTSRDLASRDSGRISGLLRSTEVGLRAES